ncbi:uncharacterized protein [Palaemon carinicauda]|uniref:uncharacterized protein isoform X2 n=1 Tax=Palaemon carinicauda TaxID=392227 RepID=UPI0035B5C448
MTLVCCAVFKGQKWTQDFFSTKWDDVLQVSHFKMDDISVMMSFPKSEANLVIVGQCSKKRKPIAVVFDLLSDQQAEQCIQDIAKAAVKGNNTSSPQKTHQPSLPVPTISNPTLIRTISSPLPIASIAGQDSQPKPQFISEQNPSESVDASFYSPYQNWWPNFRRHSIAESMSSLNLQNRKASKLVSTPSISQPRTAKIEVPLATPEATKVGKRPLHRFVPIYGNVSHHLPLPTPRTPPVSLPTKNIYENQPESNMHPTFHSPLPSTNARSNCQVYKPSILPKPEFISNNQQELLAKRAQILTPESTHSILNTVTENIYESIRYTKGAYKVPSESSADAVYLNLTPQKIPNEATIYPYTEKMKEKPTINSPINHTEIQGQTIDISLRLPELNHPLGVIPSVIIGLDNPMPIDIKGKEKPQIKSPKPLLPAYKYLKPICERPTRMPSSVGTDEMHVGSNSKPNNVEEIIRIFDGDALKTPTVGLHGYNTLKGAPSLNALNKMLELDKAEDMHLSNQYLLPIAISAGHATIDETSSPGAIPKATDDSHQSDNSSEFSVELNEEEQGSAAESGSSYSLETVINRFLMNEYAYVETLERICIARKSVPPKLQNLLRGAETLFEIHVSMYKDLYANRDLCSKIAGVFIAYREKLQFYKYYMLNSPEISILIVDLPDTVKANHPLLIEDVKNSWKRIHYYYMSLEIMMSLSKEEEMSSVNESIDLMKHLNMEADSGILIDCIKNTPYNLHLKAPVLLRSSFKISGPGLKWNSIFYVLLFSELIVITSPKGNHYVYQMDIYIQQTNFIDTRQDNKFQLEVDRGSNKGKVNYTFKSYEEGVKKAWVEEIEKLQFTIAQRERTERNKRFGIETE